MSYTSLRNQMQNTSSVNSSHDYVKKYLVSDIVNKIQALNEKYLEHLFSDVSGLTLQKDLKNFLGGGKYSTSNEYAKHCVTQAFYCNDIFGFAIQSWTESLLKAMDNFPLVIINEVLNEKIKADENRTTDSFFKERDKYEHLIQKGGVYLQIGQAMDVVYQQRNSFTHIEVIDENGFRRQKPPNSKKLKLAKEIILEQMKIALTNIYSIIPA